METKQLKEYLKAVLELEGALYRNEKATTEYARKRELNVPEAPKRIHVSKPNSPKSPEKPGPVKTIISVGAPLSTFCFVMLCCTDFDSYLWPLYFVVLLLGLGMMILGIYLHSKYKRDCSVYQEEMIAYNEKMKNFEKETASAQEENYLQMKIYNDRKSKYFAETTKNSQEFNGLTGKLKDALSQMYAMDILYPKYQNIVAVATIYEYIDSGRCSELTGPNGAYNLYESELRANLIIGSLSQINQNLQGIRENQFALYTLIEESNRSVTRLLSGIYNEQAKTAYFTQTIAAISQANLTLNALKD